VTRWRWCSTSSAPSPRSAGVGVNEGTLGNWVAKARRERTVGVGLNGDERTELAELRAEVTQLRMERDLLKRSMAFWVKELAP
jgi:transposase